MASLPTKKLSSSKSRLNEATKNTSPVKQTASNEVDQLAEVMAPAFQSNQPASRFVHPLPHKLEVGDDFELWSDKVRRYVDLMNVPHPNAFVIDSVGRSLEMYTIGLDYVHMPLITLLSTLKARIVPPVPHIESLKRFSECNQRQGESINQFILRLRTLARQAMQDKTYSEVEDAIFSKFLQGVDFRYRKDFNLHTPASMAEAETSARLVESLEEPGTTCPQVNAMGHPNRTTKYAQNPTPPWKGRPQSQSTSRNDCYYCRRFGKLARSCGHNAEDEQFV
ncbi:unnamed protein product [Trichobilharzia szidati]|nr:unnamed protein product [Trichobilharzia szidati]